MAVIVHKDEPIDQALKRLHREVVRENVLVQYKEKRYYIKPTTKRSEIKKEYQKRKRKHRQSVRRNKKQ